MQNQTAQQIQNELEFMRRMYAQRRSLNHPRHQRVIVWGLLALVIILPTLIAAGIFLS
jgi:hypothetical protein